MFPATDSLGLSAGCCGNQITAMRKKPVPSPCGLCGFLGEPAAESKVSGVGQASRLAAPAAQVGPTGGTEHW